MKKNASELTVAEKLSKLGKAKYGSKFIKVIFPDNQPFVILEHRGYRGRRMADYYGFSDGSIDKEYDQYFGKVITVNEAIRMIKKVLKKH